MFISVIALCSNLAIASCTFAQDTEHLFETEADCFAAATAYSKLPEVADYTVYPYCVKVTGAPV